MAPLTVVLRLFVSSVLVKPPSQQSNMNNVHSRNISEKAAITFIYDKQKKEDLKINLKKQFLARNSVSNWFDCSEILRAKWKIFLLFGFGWFNNLRVNFYCISDQFFLE